MMAGIHRPRDAHSCGDISPGGVQTTMAVKWIVDILNGAGDFSKAFVPGIRLGFDVYDDCGIRSRATDGVSELVPLTDSSVLMQCSENCNASNSDFLGLISSSTMEATSAALSVLSPSITGMTSLSTYNDISDRRVTFSSSEDTEIMGIVEWMKELKWSLIAVVYTDDQLSTAMYKSLVQHSIRAKICLANVLLIHERELSSANSRTQLEPIIGALEKEQKKLMDEKLSVLFLGSTDTAKLLFQYIRNRDTNVIVHKLQWVLPSNIHLDFTLKNTLISQQNQNMPKVIMVEKQHRSLPSFQSYFINELKHYNMYTSLPRQYLEGYKQEMFGGSSASDSDLTKVYRQSESVLPTVSAILTLASSLRQMQKRLCTVSSNFCKELKSSLADDFLRLDSSNLEQEIGDFSLIPEDLNNLTISNSSNTFSFPSFNDLQFSLFEPSDQTYQKLASLENGKVVVHDQTKTMLLTSECKAQCEECWDKDTIEYAYIPGDVLLLGIFSLREDGSTSSTDSANKYNCGMFRDSYTPITVSSFLHSITSLQQLTVIGQKVGGIALDDCYNPLSISYLLSELFTGRRILKDPNTGENVDFSKVIAVIGALSSKVTQVIADQLTLLDIPLISYGASSASLDNRIRYPLFLRTVPSDDFQVQGFVDVLEKLQFSHVGVIYLDDAYGQNAKQSFLLMTEYKKICVEEPLPITEDFTSEQLQNIVNKLTEQRVKVVLFIGIDTVAEILLDKLKTQLADVHFTFLASEGWGTHKMLIDGDRGKAAAGTLVFVTNDSFYVDGSFKLYLENLTSLSGNRNPWLDQFWENVLECDFQGSYHKRYSKSCNAGVHFTKDQIDSFISFQRSVHVHHATYAIEMAYRHVIDDVSCQYFRTRQCAEKFVSRIKNTELISNSGQRIKDFKEDGNGLMGFIIYNIQAVDQNKYQYVKVGSYSSTSSEMLQLNTTQIKIFKEGNPPIPISKSELGATCEEASISRDNCRVVCPITTTPPTTVAVKPSTAASESSSDNASMLNIVLAVVCGVLLLFLIIVVVMMCRQQKLANAFYDKDKTTKSPSLKSLEIYDEPYRERKVRTTSFEQSEHKSSSTSGVVSIRSSAGRGGAKNFSNGTTQSIKSPVKYSDVLQLEVPGTDILKYGSRASVNTYLDPANNEVPRIEITRDDSDLRDFRARGMEQIQRHHSADNIGESNSNLNYIQAKDLEMDDDDELVRQQEAELNYRQRAISLNEGIHGQPDMFPNRPNTLPGIPSRSDMGSRDQMHTPSFSAPAPARHILPMYLDAVHDSQINDPSSYPTIPVHMNGHPNGSQLLMVSPGNYIPSFGYQGVPSSGYHPVYIPTAPHSIHGPTMAFVNPQDARRPRGSSFTSGIPEHSIHFIDPSQVHFNPHSVHSVNVQNGGQTEFVSNTLPSYKTRSKDQREQYHSMTSMPDVISHENDDGAEIMI